MPTLARLFHLFGLPRLRGRETLILAFVIDSLGTGLYQPFSLLYFQTVTRLDLAAIGSVLTIATFLTLPMNPVTGSLVDRFGARRLVVASHVLQAIGFIGYLVVRNLPMLFAMSFLVTAGNRIFYASATTLVATVADSDEQGRWFAFVGSIQNFGLIVGGLLAGLIVAFGSTNSYYVLVLANACSFLLTALALSWRRTTTGRAVTIQPDTQRKQRETDQPGGYRVVLADRSFLVLFLCIVVFALCPSMLSLGLPIYITQALKLPAATVGTLFAFNSVLVICLQTITVRLLEPFRRTRSLSIACLFWITGCTLMALAPQVPHELLTPYLFGTSAITTIAGMIAGTISVALAAASSPAHLLGRYMALFELAWGVAGAIAPAMFAWLYAAGPSRPWIALVGPIVIVGLVLLWLETQLSTNSLYAPGRGENRSMPEQAG